MTASREIETASLDRNSRDPADDALLGAVRKLLHASGYLSLRTLRCKVIDAVVFLQGALPSYYLKQMAQSLALRLVGVRGVTNRVEVRRTEAGEP